MTAVKLVALSLFMALAPAASRAAEPEILERGSYLVKITGCAGCHSPRNKDGEIIDELRLTGGDRAHLAEGVGRIYPPNITPDEETGIGRWSIVEIVAAIKSGVTPDGRILSTAMPWRTQSKDLSDADATAIATYLKSIPPMHHQVPASLPPPLK